VASIPFNSDFRSVLASILLIKAQTRPLAPSPPIRRVRRLEIGSAATAYIHRPAVAAEGVEKSYG
jgi:hypothetical protein